MKNKLLLGILLLIGLVMSSNVNAVEDAITVVLPATNAVITGTYNFTVTAGVDNYITNVTWYLNNVKIGSEANTSANQTTFSLNYNTVLTADTKDATLNVTTWRSEIEAYSSDSTHTGIDVDNTAPTATLSLYHSDFIRKGENMQTSTCTVSDAIDSSMTITQILTKPDSSTVTDTEIASSKAWIISKADTLMVDTSDGYTVNCSTIDDAGFTASSSDSFSVLSEEQRPEDITAKEAKKFNMWNYWWIGLIIGLAIIAVLIITLTTQDKKKKRK